MNATLSYPTANNMNPGKTKVGNKPHLVILEGPDRVGKTTLAKHIAALLGFNYLHFGAPDHSADFGYQYTNIPVEDGFHFVLDRSYLSGIFYDTVRRHERHTEDYCNKYKWLIGEIESRFQVHYFIVKRPWDLVKLGHSYEIDKGVLNEVRLKSGELDYQVLDMATRETEHELWYDRVNTPRSPFFFLSNLSINYLYNDAELDEEKGIDISKPIRQFMKVFNG